MVGLAGSDFRLLRIIAIFVTIDFPLQSIHARAYRPYCAGW